MGEKRIKRDTVSDKRNSERLRGVIVTKTAPPARGQESLARFMNEEKFLIRRPKKQIGQRKKSTGKYDD